MVIDHDTQRILDLSAKVQAKTATNQEKDEYMQILLRKGSITKEQYTEYKSGQNVDGLIQAALLLGGIFLLGNLIATIIKK